jgi:hypothetical protein
MLQGVCPAVQHSSMHEVAHSVSKAKQALEVALQTLQICEQQMETGVALQQATGTSKMLFGSFNVRQEPQSLLLHVRYRVNACLYNMALADTLDRSRPRREALREARGKLYEVVGRVVASQDQLPWPLHGQVLKLQGQVLLELGRPHEAADMSVPHTT